MNFRILLAVGIMSGMASFVCTAIAESNSVPKPPLGMSAKDLSLDVWYGFSDKSVFRMIDRRNGWARSTNAIFRTADGGNSWRKVLPLEPQQPMAAFFYDSKIAWAVSGLIDDSTNVTVYRTSNGGHTWSGVQVCERIPIMACFLSFPEKEKGWLMLIPDHGMNSSPGELYQTQDSGQTWQKVNTVVSFDNWDSYTEAKFESTQPHLTCGGPVTFRNAKSGWLVGSLASTTPGYLFTTRDHGSNWQGQTLPVPASFQNGRFVPQSLPMFFPRSGKKGIIVANFVPDDRDSGKDASVVYQTRDGGLTWRAGAPFTSGLAACSFITADEGWIWSDGPQGAKTPANGKLYFTKDGGASWKPIKSRTSLSELLKQRERIAQLDFVDKEFGRAVAMDTDLHTRIFRTTDGGVTWAAN